MTVEQNLQHIIRDISEACQSVSRNPEEVKIVAVTKYVDISRAKEAVEAGILHIGENRIEGLTEKKNELGNQVSWHFIGTLQTRKVKAVLEEEVDYIHSLDRMSLAEEIEKRATNPVRCFVQVNTSGEESKHGIPKEDAISFIRDLGSLSKIQVEGLMTMAPNTEDESVIRQTFRHLKELQEEIKGLNLDHAPCTELSMGMSNDYKIAIQEGATFIRIGSALVGN